MTEDNYEKLITYILDNQDKFYRLAFTYVKNQEDAMDVVQNAICRALEKYESIRDIHAVKTWLYRVIVNESINFMKKNRRELALDEGFASQIPYFEARYDEGAELFEEINRLPLQVQNIIKLRFYQELSLKEIAEITGLNLNTVKAKLYRGLKLLKQELGEVQYE